jgi:hypothetical protein
MSTYYKVQTTLYVSAAHASDKGTGPMADTLRTAGWTVYNADVSPRPSGIGNAYGSLAEDQPASFWIGKDGATAEEAEKAVRDAVLSTDNYSVASKVKTASVAVVDAAAKVAGAAGTVASDVAAGKKNPTVTQALNTVELVALAVALLAAAYIVFQVWPAVRKVA